jgi:hypothetical protein
MSSCCDECKIIFPKYIIHHNKNYCIFCKIINYPTINDIYSYKWGISTMSQSTINESYRKKFSEISQIVPPSIIDQNVRIISANPYIISQILSDITELNLRVFLTQNVNRSYFLSQNIFQNNQKQKQNQNQSQINYSWDLSKISYNDDSINNLITKFLSKQDPSICFN